MSELDLNGRIDLGSGHAFTWMVARAGKYDAPLEFRDWKSPQREGYLYDDNQEGEPQDLIGIIDWHVKRNPRNENDTVCGGGVYFVANVNIREGKSNPVWTVESVDPLTISPSVLCGCGEHGFIKEGRWVPA